MNRTKEKKLPIIAIYLKAVRKLYSYSQEKEANLLHTTKSSISHYETGTAIPPLDFLYSFSLLYGAEIENLVAMLNEPEYMKAVETNQSLTLLIEEDAKSKLMPSQDAQRWMSQAESEVFDYIRSKPQNFFDDLHILAKLDKLRNMQPPVDLIPLIQQIE